MRGSWISGLGLLLLLAACSSIDEQLPYAKDLGPSMVAAVQFEDLPVPAGLELLDSLHESACFEMGRYRWADLHYKGEVPLGEALDFIEVQLGQFGWEFAEKRENPPDEVILKVKKKGNTAVYTLNQEGAKLSLDVSLDSHLVPATSHMTGEGSALGAKDSPR